MVVTDSPVLLEGLSSINRRSINASAFIKLVCGPVELYRPTRFATRALERMLGRHQIYPGEVSVLTGS